MHKKTVYIHISLMVILIITGCSRGGSATSYPGTPNTSSPSLSPSITVSPSPTAVPSPMPEVRIQQAELALFEGLTETARDEYTTAAWNTDDPEVQASALLGIGRSYFQEGKYDRAVETLKSLINEHPANQSLASANYYLAESLQKLGDYSGAAEAYAASISLQPSILDDILFEKRAIVLEKNGNYPEAIEAYQLAIAASTVDRNDLNLKIGQIYATQEDYANAIKIYLETYETSSNPYIKAQANLLSGQAYLTLGFSEQAYARFQDSVNNFPQAYDSYTGLVILVNDGQTVNELQRGLVDYYAGQFGYAADAFSRFLNSPVEHDGTAHYYRGLSLRALDDITGALFEWQAFIADHSESDLAISTLKEIAYTQWAYLDDYDAAASTLIKFAYSNPSNPEAPGLLFTAARILEIGGRLTKAAEIWGQLIDQYPSSDKSWRGLFLAGITYYRLELYEEAVTIFQRAQVLAVNPFDQSAAALWVGKSRTAMGQNNEAQQAYQQAAGFDPTGYYSIRAAELLSDEPPLGFRSTFDYGVDLSREQSEAEQWMITTFNLPSDTDFSALGELAFHPLMIRGKALWNIGEYQSARDIFESLREEISSDALSSFRFMLHMVSLGAYRPAIFASRQILTLAGMDNLQTLTAPRYFNTLRFGLYFRDLILQEAKEEEFHPLLLFSIIRQESFFEGFVQSSAGAFGLMQIMPATGLELATRYAWPENYSQSDLLNPYINITLGVKYLSSQRQYFSGSLYAALAAYNGGPGNAFAWFNLAGDDPDLLLEIIRFDETRKYIINIVEFSNLYAYFYSR